MAPGPSTTFSESLQCSRATTPAQIDEARRFRYRIYVAEQGKTLSTADHECRMLIDPLDEGAWHFVCHVSGGELVGSCRLHCGARLPSRIENSLRLTEFMTHYAQPVGYISKLMFARNLRGRGAALQLLSHVYRSGRDAGAMICFSHCNPKLAPLYERMGLHRFGHTFVDSEVGPQVPLVQILEDESHYRECRSPLLKDCSSYANDTARVGELRHWFLRRMAWQPLIVPAPSHLAMRSAQ
jgi:predicted GNAT family N-acyltransferase